MKHKAFSEQRRKSPEGLQIVGKVFYTIFYRKIGGRSKAKTQGHGQNV